MIAWLRHVLHPAYLYAQRTVPEQVGGVWFPALLAAMLLGVSLTWRPRRGVPGGPRILWEWRIAAGALGVAVALFALHRVAAGPLSARIWYLSAAVPAAGAALLAVSRRPLARIPWLGQVLDATTGWLRPDAPHLPWGATAALGAMHLAGLAALLAAGEAGWWLPALVLGCLAAAGPRRVELLSPLALSYAGHGLCALVESALGVDTGPYQAFPYPDPWSPWFDGRVTLLMGAGAALLLTANHALRRVRVPAAARHRLVALAVAGSAALWFVAAVSAHLSHGATGSDAFCYLQMASDIVSHASPRHTFALARLLWEHGLPAWPAVPVGYHPPDAAGLAATVWPIGWPVMLAPLFVLGGEGHALWGAPLCALLAGWLTYRLARDLAPEASPIAGALAAAILLTSREGALRALVPMADAAARALSVAMLLCLWRGRRRDSLVWSALAGLALAWAYWVRHPVLPLGLAAIPAMLWPTEHTPTAPEYSRAARQSWRRRLAHLGVFIAAALAGAIPDLAYHRLAFGSIWTAESPEWFLLSWRHIVPSVRAMLRDGWLRREEFGFLAPFILLGMVWHGRHRVAAATLWVALIGVLLFNLAYSALRLRDLLSLFPWPALWAGWGMVALWRWAASTGEGGRLRRTAALVTIALALAARASPSMGLPWQEGVWTFGHVTATQRAAFDALARELPPDAVVATGLNAGAVRRYTGRDAVRPGSWSDDELLAFATLLAERGHPLYLLVDGEEMEAVLDRVRGLLALEPAGVFGIPMMGRGGQWQEGRATLHVVAPN